MYHKYIYPSLYHFVKKLKEIANDYSDLLPSCNCQLRY
jgi:hypothetical protein